MSKEWAYAYRRHVRDSEFLRQNDMMFGDPKGAFLIGESSLLDDIAMPGAREAKLSRDDPRAGILIEHFDPREDMLLVALHGAEAVARQRRNGMAEFSYVLTGYDISAGKGTLVEPAVIQGDKISVLRDPDCSFAFVLGVEPEDIAPVISRVLVPGQTSDAPAAVPSRNIVVPDSAYTH